MSAELTSNVAPHASRRAVWSSPKRLSASVGRVLSFGRVSARDVIASAIVQQSAEAHLAAAVHWLERAHDAGEDGGVSYGYSLHRGWRPSYRETSGYIIETLFDVSHAMLSPELAERARRIARWLIEVQNADGSYSNPGYSRERGIVFDTGQVLFGLLRAHQETGEVAYLAAAEHAGEWLVTIADDAGRWTRNTHLGVPHVYNTRTAWALLELWKHSRSPDCERVARANLDFALSRERSCGFADCAFTPEVAPFTHTIAYAVRGLLESGRILQDDRYVEVARRAADACLEHLRDDGFVPGQIDPDGAESTEYCCLTGNAQLAIVWLKLSRSTGEPRYAVAASRALRYVMSAQSLDANDDGVRGGIKGSQPIWGRYAPFTFPNWAAKFFIDAMMLKEGAT